MGKEEQLEEVQLNQNREYIEENIMSDMGEKHEWLNDATKINENALFVSKEMVYRDIGE